VQWFNCSVLTVPSDKCIVCFKEDRTKTDARVPKGRSSDKNPQAGPGTTGQRREERAIKKI